MVVFDSLFGSDETIHNFKPLSWNLWFLLSLLVYLSGHESNVLQGTFLRLSLRRQARGLAHAPLGTLQPNPSFSHPVLVTNPAETISGTTTAYRWDLCISWGWFGSGTPCRYQKLCKIKAIKTKQNTIQVRQWIRTATLQLTLRKMTFSALAHAGD